MEIISRRHTYTLSDGPEGGIESNDVSETHLKDVKGPLASVLALALVAGVTLSAYDLGRVAENLSRPGMVDISASAVTSPVRRTLDFNALGRRARELASLSIAASAEQMDFQFEEVDADYLLSLIHEFEGDAIVERDPDTGVVDSITASFSAYQTADGLSIQAAATPKKIVGDLAQTSITTSTGEEQIIGLAEWTISWKRKTVESTTTDDALYEGALGSTKSWTVKAKYMFIDGDQSQVDGVLSAIDTTALDPTVWNFFPTTETGRAAFSGLAFIDGIDIGSGSGKIVGLDVSLKGTGPLKRSVQIAPVANTNTVTGQQAEV